MNQKQGIETMAAAFTDHMAVVLRIATDDPIMIHGTGYWTMNTTLRRQNAVQQNLQIQWTKWKTHQKFYPNHVTWWERYVKPMLKRTFQRKGTEHHRERRTLENFYDLPTHMADVACGTKCCATNLLNYSTPNGLRDCAKCAELEIQLQQICEELSSVQLIIQLLDKERVQGMTATTPIQVTEAKWEVDKDWEVMTQRGAKKRAEDNINISKKGLLNFRGQAVVTANSYAALEADSHLLQNEDEMVPIYEKTIGTLNVDQEEKIKHIAQNYSITSASQEKLDLESKVEHNLQNHSLTHQPLNTKQVTYNIPTIINGRLSREGTSQPIERRTL